MEKYKRNTQQDYIDAGFTKADVLGLTFYFLTDFFEIVEDKEQGRIEKDKEHELFFYDFHVNLYSSIKRNYENANHNGDCVSNPASCEACLYSDIFAEITSPLAIGLRLSNNDPLDDKLRWIVSNCFQECHYSLDPDPKNEDIKVMYPNLTSHNKNMITMMTSCFISELKRVEWFNYPKRENL